MGAVPRAATLKAAGTQAYVLKFQGTFSADASNLLAPPPQKYQYRRGQSDVISDAAFIMEYCHLAHMDGCSFQNTNGHGVTTADGVGTADAVTSSLLNCGTLNTGSAFFIDGPTPLDYARGCSDIRIAHGVWSSNRGRWLDVSSLANIDGFLV